MLCLPFFPTAYEDRSLCTLCSLADPIILALTINLIRHWGRELLANTDIGVAFPGLEDLSQFLGVEISATHWCLDFDHHGKFEQSSSKLPYHFIVQSFY